MSGQSRSLQLASVVAAICLSLSAAMMWQRFDGEGQRRLERRVHAAEDLRSSLAARIRAADAQLRELNVMAQLADLAEAGTFETFASAIVASSPQIRVLEWVPEIRHAERESLEAELAAEFGRPNPIREISPDGLVAAGVRERYFPVRWIHPLAGNESALGLDLASEPTRAAALGLALTEMRPIATAPVQLVQRGAHASYLVFVPVRRGAVQQLLLAVIEPTVMLEDLDVDDHGLGVSIVDITDLHAKIDVGQIAGETAGDTTRLVADRLQLAGRTLEVGIEARRAPAIAWSAVDGWLLAAALLLSAAMTALTWIVTGRNQRIRDLVDQQTASLRDSQLRMRQLFMATPEGILIVDEEGRIEDANDQAHQLLKRRPGELVGMAVESLVPLRHRAAHALKRQAFMSSERYSSEQPMSLKGEFRALRADGEELPVALGVSPLEHDGGRKAIVVLGDLSGQISMNARLRDERDLRQRSLDALANLLLALDTNGHVTMVNRFGCEFLGRGESSILGGSLFGRFSPEPGMARRALNRALEALAEGHESASARVALTGADGRSHVIDWRFSALRGDDGRISGCMASGIDVTEKLEAESAAMRFAANLEATLHALPDLLLEFDEFGRILDIQSGRDDLLAGPRHEMIGRVLSEVLPADSVAPLLKVIDLALAEGRGSSEMTMTLPGERRLWIDVSASRKVGGGDRPTCVMVLRDATERMLAQREAEHMRSVVLASGELLACINMARAVEVANPAFTRTFDCPTQAVAGQALAAILDEVTMAKLEVALVRVFDGELQRLSLDVGDAARQRTLELELAPLWDEGDVTGAVLSGHDITDRAAVQRTLESYRDTLEREVRERTAALDRTRARLAHTLESSPVPTFVVDADGRVSHWNKACGIAFGVSAVDLIGTAEAWRAFYDEPQPVMAELIVAGQTDRLRRLYGSACWPSSLVEGAFEAEWHFPKLGRWLFLTAAPMLDDDGNCIGAIETLQDVTARKEAEQMTARAREAAESAARAKSEFLANMSHEIRTPLNGVIGLAQVGVRENAGRRAHHTFDKIHRSAVHLLGLINDLLDFSKIESGRFELEDCTFELTQIVDQALDIATPGAFERHIAVLVSESPALPKELQGDGLRLTQCLVNLLGNAIKFTEAGSVRLDVDHDGHMLSLTVRDTGIGMSDEQISRLFRPFEQADGSTTRKFGGTGLGLAITHQLVSMMGGTMKVDSELGRGSRFELQVPLPVVVPAGDACNDLPPQVIQTGLEGEEADLLERELSRRGCRLLSLAPAAAARMHGEILLGTVDALALAADAGADESSFVVIHDPGPAPRLGRINWPRPLLVRRLAALLAGEQVANAGDAPRRLARMQVLGVDDNEVNRFVLADLLRLEGVSLRLAASGEEALELVRSLPADAFDIALLDIEMPGMDGYTLARQLKRLRPGLPLIGLTAHASQSDRAKCLDAGMADHIAKPYEIDHLVESMRKLAVRPVQENSMTAETTSEPDPAPEGGADHVDMEALLKRFRGRSEFVMKLLRTAAEAHQSASSKITDAVSRRDFDSLRQVAHSVKGMSGNLCANALQQQAAEVERMARAREDAVFNEAGAFAGEVDSLVSSIRKLLVE